MNHYTVEIKNKVVIDLEKFKEVDFSSSNKKKIEALKRAEIIKKQITRLDK